MEVKADLRKVINNCTKGDELSKLNYNDVYNKTKHLKDEIKETLLDRYHVMRLTGIITTIKDPTGIEVGVYFQDEYMKQMYNSYSDLIFFDGTYNFYTKRYNRRNENRTCTNIQCRE